MSIIAATVLASTVRNVGAVIAVLAVLAVVVYAIINIRSGRDEIGSEIELAPNRKPYYDDEGLEGKRLDRWLASGLVTLAVVALGLPLYWLNEPARMDGAVDNFAASFVSRGENLYYEGAACGDCHGPDGVGGVAPFTLLDEDNEFVATVSWQAPALDTVMLRMSDDEVMDVLVYGRPGTPMPAWGEAGGGPLTTQQLTNLIAYMHSITLSPEEARGQVETELRSTLNLAEGEEINYDDQAVGEALFNLGRSSGLAGGAYSCGRCHTRGWSIQEGSEAPENADLSDFVDFPDGSGAFGFSLRFPLIPRQFLTLEDMEEFIHLGSEDGVGYGEVGQGRGRMPGFGDNPNTDEENDGMMTPEMISAIVAYVNSLSEGNGGGADNGADGGAGAEEAQG